MPSGAVLERKEFVPLAVIVIASSSASAMPMDSRKEELDRKRAKLAELRKARDERRSTQGDRQSNPSDRLPTQDYSSPTAVSTLSETISVSSYSLTTYFFFCFGAKLWVQALRHEVAQTLKSEYMNLKQVGKWYCRKVKRCQTQHWMI